MNDQRHILQVGPLVIRPTVRTLLWIFVVALAVRLALHVAYTPPLVGDAREYYYNSQTLENTVGQFPYEHWYQRSPAYTAFLHISGQSLLVQILLAALTCVFLELLYPRAGWAYAFYPPGILYANVYMKETLLIFLFVLAAYLLRNHKWWLLLALPVIFAGFISYGGVWEYNTAVAAGQRSFIHRVYILWRPEWHFTILVPAPPPWLELILRGSFILVYVPVLILFIRKVTFSDFEFWLVTGFSLVAVFSFGNERFREPVMPFIIGYVTPIAAGMTGCLRRMLAEKKQASTEPTG